MSRIFVETEVAQNDQSESITSTTTMQLASGIRPLDKIATVSGSRREGTKKTAAPMFFQEHGANTQ